MQNTINIGGQQYPIQWNFKAAAAYEKSTGESFYAIGEELSKAFTDDETPKLKVTVIAGLVYAAIIGAGGRITEDIIFENIVKNAISQEDFAKVMTLYYDAMPKADPNAEPSQAPTEPLGEPTGQPSKDELA